MNVASVDQFMPVLDGQHELRISTVTLTSEYFEVAYAISPALPRGPGDVVLPRIEATDDRGRLYNDSGGAYGLSDDGTRTEGSITGQPGFPADVREVTLRFVLVQRGAEAAYEVPVTLR